MVKSVLEQTLDELAARAQIVAISPRLASKFGKALAARRVAAVRESEPRKTRKRDRKSETLSEPTIDRLERMLSSRYWTGMEGTYEGAPARVLRWYPADSGVKEESTVDLMVEKRGLVSAAPFGSFTKKTYWDE